MSAPAKPPADFRIVKTADGHAVEKHLRHRTRGAPDYGPVHGASGLSLAEARECKARLERELAARRAAEAPPPAARPEIVE